MKYISLLLLFGLLLWNVPCGQAQRRSATYDDIARGMFSMRGLPPMRPMADGEHYTLLRDNRIIKYRYADGKAVDTLFDARRQLVTTYLKKMHVNDTLIIDTILSNPKEIRDYSFSADGEGVLLTTSSTPVYRHSALVEAYAYFIPTGTITQVGGSGFVQEPHMSGAELYFVRDNNLYWQFATDERGERIRQLTADGQKGKIINGHTDWVYEEEYAFTRAYEASPSDRYLAWLRFDESEVKLYDMPVYAGLGYPQSESFKYPRAGEQNSRVTVHIARNDSASVTVPFPAGIDTSDYYIPRIEWVTVGRDGLYPIDRLVVHHLNRQQNEYTVFTVDPETLATKAIYRETDPRYIDRIDENTLVFVPANTPPATRSYQRLWKNRGFAHDPYAHAAPCDRFIVKSERDGWRHLYLYDLDGKLIRQLTKGEWEVTTLDAVDPALGVIWYTSTEQSPLRRDLYTVGFDGKGKKRLTDTPRGTHSAVFSSFVAPRYYTDTYSDAQTPPSATLHEAPTGRLVRVLSTGAEPPANTPVKEFFRIEIEPGVKLDAWVMKPDGYSPAADCESRKFPVLITQYSGPGSQQVADRWSFGWETALLREGIAVVCIDPRGTGFRGEQWRKCTYGQLGRIEAEDMIAAAEVLPQNLTWADPSRIGIYGWSYGGFMALNCILKGADVFVCAIAVAPVTSWRYYDTIYTELYNGRPQDNAAGYDDNSPVNYAGNLRGKLLLAHGTADDNVHIQNAYEMITRLTKTGKEFEWLIYPDRNHSMGPSRDHLLRRCIEFLKENL